MQFYYFHLTIQKYYQYYGRIKIMLIISAEYLLML